MRLSKNDTWYASTLLGRASATSQKRDGALLPEEMSGSHIFRWWISIDRWAFLTVVFLSLCGVLLVSSASPMVATHIGLSPSHFIIRHLCYVCLTFGLLILVSQISHKTMICLSFFGCCIGVFLLVMTLIVGVEIKGARRWMMLGPLSLQPSEFLKPCFILITGWLFARFLTYQRPGALWLNGGAMVLFVSLLFLQPDVGMVVLLMSSWGAQLFLFGIPLKWFFCCALSSVVALGGAYFFLPHVQQRIDHFIGLTQADRFGKSYQISQSLEAFGSGGIFGKGPGEGIIKRTLPDVHSDFIFAVAGEEFGLILPLLIISLFIYFFVRTVMQLLYTKNLFVLIAGTGLLTLFTFQAMINIASTLNLIPTKGMTLPLISYGGSSLLGTGITLGFLFGLVRRR